MGPNHRKYKSEPELHEIFARLLANFDKDPEADLTPRVDHIDAFLSLYRMQGRLWLSLYEVEPYELIKLLYRGSEKTFGLSDLPDEPSAESLKNLVDRLSKAAADPSCIDPSAIDDSLKLKAVTMILASRCLMISHVCMLQYHEMIQTLVAEARNGNPEAFLDLVKLDSAFLLSDFGQAMLIEMELRQDVSFKAELADVLSPDPRFWSLKGKRDNYIFLILWSLADFAYRPDSDWAQFLSDHGFDNWADESNVRRNRERYKLPKLKR